jgi:large subunit ribosomal protein L31e
MADQEEKIITIALYATKQAPRTHRAERAIKEIRSNVARHTKSEEKDVWLDKTVNEKIWEHGIQNPPKKVTVKAVKYDDGLVEVTFPETETKPRAEKPKAKAKAVAAPKEKSEEPKAVAAPKEKSAGAKKQKKE